MLLLAQYTSHCLAHTVTDRTGKLDHTARFLPGKLPGFLWDKVETTFYPPFHQVETPGPGVERSGEARLGSYSFTIIGKSTRSDEITEIRRDYTIH